MMQPTQNLHVKEIVRLLPPLNVSRETMDQALGILDEALASVSRAQVSPQLAAVQ